MVSLKQRVADMSKSLKQASDSDVIHVQTLRKAIPAYVGVVLKPKGLEITQDASQRLRRGLREFG